MRSASSWPSMKRPKKRPQIRTKDRLFWILLCRFWSNWQEALIIVKPETVIRWHRKGFKLFWKFKSRHKGPGRPPISPEIRDLILKMAKANPLWGAPRIHGELLKLGIEISERTVSNLMPRRMPKPPSQTWRTFLKNHMTNMVSIDFFTVPTATFRILFVLVILSHSRRQVVHFNVTPQPYGQVDGSTDYRGVSLGHGAKVSAEGSGLDLRSVFPSTREKYGHKRGYHGSSKSLAKSVR